MERPDEVLASEGEAIAPNGATDIEITIQRRAPDGSRWAEIVPPFTAERRAMMREQQEQDRANERIMRGAMRRFHDAEHILALGVAVGDPESMRRANSLRLPVALPVRDVKGEYLGRIVRPGISDDSLESYAGAVVRANGRQGVEIVGEVILNSAQWKNRRGATVRKHLRQKAGLDVPPAAASRPERRSPRSRPELPDEHGQFQDDSEPDARRHDKPIPTDRLEDVLEFLEGVLNRTRSTDQGAVLSEFIRRLRGGEPCIVWDVATALVPDARRREAVVRGIERVAVRLVEGRKAG